MMEIGKKAQFSMEYLLTVVIVISLFIPVLLFSYYSALEKTQKIEEKQLEQLGIFFLNNIEKVYSAGVPSRITAKQKVTVPLKNITAGGFKNHDVIFILDDNRNFSFSSDYPLQINVGRPIKKGIITIRFDAVYNGSGPDKSEIVNITLID